MDSILLIFYYRDIINFQKCHQLMERDFLKLLKYLLELNKLMDKFI